jgi:hypothetical protein
LELSLLKTLLQQGMHLHKIRLFARVRRRHLSLVRLLQRRHVCGVLLANLLELLLESETPQDQLKSNPARWCSGSGGLTAIACAA